MGSFRTADKPEVSGADLTYWDPHAAITRAGNSAKKVALEWAPTDAVVVCHIALVDLAEIPRSLPGNNFGCMRTGAAEFVARQHVEWFLEFPRLL